MAEKDAKDGLTATERTRRQELTTAWLFRRALKNNKTYKDVEDMLKDKVFVTEIIGEKSKPGIFPEVLFPSNTTWLNSFVLQQRKFFDEFAGSKFTEFSREHGFMDYISKLVKKRFGISKKDTWNPADIWCIQNEKKIIDEIDEVIKKHGLGTLDELNVLLRTMFKDRRVVGISLKKTGKEVHYKEFNVDEGLSFISNKQNSFVVTAIKSDFKWNASTKKYKANYSSIAFTVVENGHKEDFTIGIKSNSLSHFKGLVFTPKSVKNSSAQEGGAPINMIIELMAKFGISGFENKWQDYPKNALEFKQQEKKYLDMFKTVLRNPMIDLNVTSASTFVDDMLMQCITPVKDNDTGDGTIICNSKLMQLHFFYLISKLSRDEINEFFTEMFFLGQKRGKRFGPFGKIY
jgi:hypothetical protein